VGSWGHMLDRVPILLFQGTHLTQVGAIGGSIHRVIPARRLLPVVGPSDFVGVSRCLPSVSSSHCKFTTAIIPTQCRLTARVSR
jgi:hypothetical protein